MTDQRLKNKLFVRVSDLELTQFESACCSMGMNYSDALRTAIASFALKVAKRKTQRRGERDVGAADDFY